MFFSKSLCKFRYLRLIIHLQYEYFIIAKSLPELFIYTPESDHHEQLHYLRKYALESD